MLNKLSQKFKKAQRKFLNTVPMKSQRSVAFPTFLCFTKWDTHNAEASTACENEHVINT